MAGGDSVADLAAETTYYFPIAGDFDSGFTTEANIKLETQVAFTASLPTARVENNTIDNATTVTLRINGGDSSNLQISIAGDSGAGWFEDATGSDSIAANDDLDWKIVVGATGTGNISFVTIGMLCAAAGGTTINLIANIAGVSTTPSVAGVLARALLANIGAVSSTPDAAATVQRAMTAAIAVQSLTPDIAITMLWSLIANIPGSSVTPDIAAAVTRALTAAPAGASTSPDISALMVRALVATISGSSLTPEIAATIQRDLSAAVSASSTASDIDAAVARALLAAIPGSSLTPDISIAITRSLAANIAAVSTTPDITATIQGVISLVASITGVSSTPEFAATTVRELIAAIPAESATADAVASIVRSLTSNVAALSTTPDITATVENMVNLSAAIVGASEMPERLSNPGFETLTSGFDDDNVGDNFAGWIENTFLDQKVEAVTDKHGGARAVKCSNGGRISAVVEVEPGEVCQLAFWTHGDGVHAGYWEVREYSQLDVIASGHPGIIGTDYAYVRTSIEIPEYTTVINVNLRVADGSAWFDDASFRLSGGGSVTPEISATVARSLVAAIMVESVTPEAAATVARSLVAAISGTSVTADDLVLILASLGVILDPSIVSVTPMRVMETETLEREFESVTVIRTIEAI